MRKPALSLCENKSADQLRCNHWLVPLFLLHGRILLLNPKFQALSLLLKLYSPVCVGPSQ